MIPDAISRLRSRAYRRRRRLSVTRTEQTTTDADHRRTLLDRHFEIS
ncbi:MAG: hypothetical protein QOF30_3443, partial [Acidimicrobiaceae bacterium]|nr:hypothetical protein [Acidimicrobiaceae bacterium]